MSVLMWKGRVEQVSTGGVSDLQVSQSSGVKSSAS